jgi:hypothetical protein
MQRKVKVGDKIRLCYTADYMAKVQNSEGRWVFPAFVGTSEWTVEHVTQDGFPVVKGFEARSFIFA